MRMGKIIRAVTGIVLCGAGFVLAVPSIYHERLYVIDAGGCRLETTIVEPQGGPASGSVILLHGLAANKKVMSYIAHSFAGQKLRVFVPDLPGHGRSAEPFSPARVQKCTEGMLQELLQRGVVTADRTILAGHSMGAALAMRVAAHVPVAGVIAISPAPSRTAYGVQTEMLLWSDPSPLPPNTLVISGGLEFESMRGNARELLQSSADGSSKLLLIPWASHGGLLLNSRMLRASEEWASHLLHLEPSIVLPSQWPLLGSLIGFLGLLLLAGPFLREILGKKTTEEAASSGHVSIVRGLMEAGLVSLAAVGTLKYWNPLNFLHIFEGSYLASFFLLVGVALLGFHARSLLPLLSKDKPTKVLVTACAALALFILIAAWFDLTIFEAWLGKARWVRFPVFLIAVLPYHLAEEFFLQPYRKRASSCLLVIFSFRLLLWAALCLGILKLHSGEILFALMAPYFFLLFLLQQMGVNVVRQETGSVTAAAMFGAILLAGFSLVIFPVT